ncbi:MAG: hypothetical protein JXO22_03720 [Phycisphaerae bacterium]|nr:hypothetical protein [Phycisphaerae bacterium]
MPTAAPPPPTPAFPVHARGVMRSVRGAFSELITDVGASPHDSQGLSRACGLNKNLAWKVSKLIQTEDPAVAIQQMPGSGGIEIFLRSMERAGAREALLKTARDAIRDFDKLIQLHSGDRATLEMMGSALSSTGRQQRDEYHRRLLFQGGSYVWGAQARVMLKVGIVGRGKADGLLDFLSLSALVGFRRLRPDVTWTMAARRARHDDGSPMFPPGPEPIDPNSAGDDKAPLMLDFCSGPLPHLRRVEDATGISFELPEGPVGNTGALTCVTGTIQRGIPYYRSPSNEMGEHRATCDLPAELLLFDLFIHNSFTFAMPPEMGLYSDLNTFGPYPGRGRDFNRLPIYETLQDLGCGPLPLATPDVANYNQMVQTMFDRVGWRPTDFRGYRVKIAYPACPASVVLRYDLPEAP